MQLEIKNLAHAYSENRTLTGISFDLQQGDIACLLGPSGSGKTTLLRCIAGFEKPSLGEIYAHGQLIASAQIQVAAAERQIGMMFQDYALLPHLTVAKNIAFGLHRLSRSEAKKRVSEILEIVSLQDYKKKYPHQLSGGQQQRVALARAIAPNPRLILMDEPFSNLDVGLRESLGKEIRKILKHYGMTALMVTHDQHEAFALSDYIGVIYEGELQQWDKAYNLYHKPANRFVANFVGQGAFISGHLNAQNQIEIELGVLHGQLLHKVEHNQAVDVLLRPDDVIHDDSSALTATVVHKAFRGADILYTLVLASGERVLSLVPSHHDHAIGEAIGIRLEADHIVAFNKM